MGEVDRIIKSNLKSEKEVFEMVKKIVNLIREKEGENTLVLNMKNTYLMVDYFVITTGNSDTHLAALRDHVVNLLRETDWEILHYDKGKGYDWLLIDAGSIIIHLFTKKGREFYDLEGLWIDSERIEI